MAFRRKNGKVTAGRRPKAQRAEMDTRVMILAAARKIFAAKGIDGTSVREVAKAAKVNSAMIYYHYRDKTGLYRAVLSDSFTTFDRIWEHPIFRGKAPARKKIEKYMEEFIRFEHANEDLRRILSMEFANCGRNCKWLANTFFVHGYERLSRILAQGMRSGELKRIDPAIALSSLFGMIVQSFIMQPIAEIITGKKLDLSVRRFGKFATGLFFDGLGSTPGNLPAGKKILNI
jgi:TetR/AcrR family transcriptional regulator